MSSHKISLLFFSYGILEQGGGFENYIIQTAADLQNYRNVFDTAIITSTPQLTEKLQKLLTIYFLKKHENRNIYREKRENVLIKLGRSKYIQVSNLNELVKQINNYDYLYIKNEILELVILKLIRRKINTRIIIGVHTPIHYPFTPSLSAKLHNLLYTGFFYKWLIKDALSIKVNTISDKIYVEQKFKKNNVEVVHHSFKLHKLNQVLNNDKKLRVLFVGRLTEQKGIDTLLSIMHKIEIRKKMNNFSFRIIGSGEEKLENDLKAFAYKNSQVKLFSHVDNHKVSDHYNWADVVIIPSKYETLNKVAVEAAMAGKVAISSDIPGPREVIDNNKTGFLLPNVDDEFVNKLFELLDLKMKKYEILRGYGCEAFKKIKVEFNPTKIYEDFYHSLLTK